MIYLASVNIHVNVINLLLMQFEFNIGHDIDDSHAVDADVSHMSKAKARQRKRYNCGNITEMFAQFLLFCYHLA